MRDGGDVLAAVSVVTSQDQVVCCRECGAPFRRIVCNLRVVSEQVPFSAGKLLLGLLLLLLRLLLRRLLLLLLCRLTAGHFGQFARIFPIFAFRKSCRIHVVFGNRLLIVVQVCLRLILQTLHVALMGGLLPDLVKLIVTVIGHWRFRSSAFVRTAMASVQAVASVARAWLRFAQANNPLRSTQC